MSYCKPSPFWLERNVKIRRLLEPSTAVPSEVFRILFFNDTATTEIYTPMRGADVPKTHSLGRCYECNRAFAWPTSEHRHSDGVYCPACGKGLGLTTRLVRASFYVLADGQMAACSPALSRDYFDNAERCELLAERRAS
jgi:hypothetical protein